MQQACALFSGVVFLSIRRFTPQVALLRDRNTSCQLLFDKFYLYMGTSNFKKEASSYKMPAVCSFKTVSRLVPAEFGCNIILAVQDLRETHKMQRSPLLCVDDASPAGSGTESTYSEDEEDLNIFSYKKKHSPDIVCVCVLTLQYCSFTFSAHSWHTWLTNENSITTLDRHHWEHL